MIAPPKYKVKIKGRVIDRRDINPGQEDLSWKVKSQCQQKTFFSRNLHESVLVRPSCCGICTFNHVRDGEMECLWPEFEFKNIEKTQWQRLTRMDHDSFRFKENIFWQRKSLQANFETIAAAERAPLESLQSNKSLPPGNIIFFNPRKTTKPNPWSPPP